MNTHKKMITCALVSALLMFIAVPSATQAGTLTIYNKNCTKTKNWRTVKRVTVRVHTGNTKDGCTNTKVTVHQNHSKTVELIEKNDEGGDCKYGHEAMGTVYGKFKVRGDKNSSVTCKRDWAKVCQCTKD